MQRMSQIFRRNGPARLRNALPGAVTDAAPTVGSADHRGTPAAVTVNLPYPPSLNAYYRSNRGRVHISAAGVAYREAVWALVYKANARMMLTDRLALTIFVWPPDRRLRDLDNLLKSCLDALQHARLYENDGQIDRLTVQRMSVDKPGRIRVTVESVGGPLGPD